METTLDWKNRIVVGNVLVELISEFCLGLDIKPENLTQVAELTVAQEYNELREKVLIYAPDKLGILPPSVIITMEHDSPKTHTKNIDLLTFAYCLRNWLKTNCGQLDTQALHEKVLALQSWQDVAAPAEALILKRSKEVSPSVFAEMALEKLSGDLSYDNVAAAKQILKKII